MVSFMSCRFLQGLLTLLESDVTLRCRQKDVSVVQGVIDSAVAEYKKETKKDTKVTLNTETYLPDSWFVLRVQFERRKRMGGRK